VIRAAAAGDVTAWAAMRGRLWPDADAADLAAEARAFFAGDGNSLLDAVFLAEDEAARPFGFVELHIRPFVDGCDSMPVPHVEGWYVEPSARGAGVGRELMRAAEGWARERGFTELGSDALVENELSQRAHAACGFAETERLVMFRKPL
jgi:aminoglycoside 6'-N-acetyltransferase I